MIAVAIDQAHTRQSAAGTARYSRGLAAALRQRSDVAVYELGAGPVEPRQPVKKQLLTLRQDFLWYPWLGRRAAEHLHASVYHCPAGRAPLRRGRPPLVVTIHDLVPILFPETMTKWSRWYGRTSLDHVLKAADLLITPSQDTADDLHRLMNVAYERIRVIWNGVDDMFYERGATRPPVSFPYVLFVGTLEPRKNLYRLRDAMSLLRDRGRRERLVVVGGSGWGGVKVDDERVEYMGRLADSEVKSLYEHARCLVLPSLHEGFGLPAIEAMAAGSPVVAAARGALPEVTGGAAVLVDPERPEDIAHGIEEAIDDRDRLIEKGRARASAFRWATSADATMKVYRELAS